MPFDCLRYHRPALYAAVALAVGLASGLKALAVPLEPTELEQYMLELINRARAHPEAEAARFNIRLNEGLPSGTIAPTPKQPLAFNFNLVDSARDHSQWMIDQDVFQHTGPGGNHPSDRARNAGYDLWAPWGVGENLAWQGVTRSSPQPLFITTQLHEGLFVDQNIDDRGHRTNMLAEGFQEAGVGIVTGSFVNGSKTYNAVMITTDFAYRAGNAFLTGVVYQDHDGNEFYSPDGEGYNNIAIRAVSPSTGAVYQTTSFGSGGYSLQIPAGTYDVTVGGGALLETTFLDLVMGTKNVKLDLVDSDQLRPWSNPANRFDTDRNGRIEPHDALVLIDELNRFGVRSLSTPPVLMPETYFDVDRDAFFSPGDLLPVIDAVNRAFGSVPSGQSAGGVLSFVETSHLAAVPEPGSLFLALLGISSLLTLARVRGKLPK